MSSQTADVLDRARDLLDRDGWRQGVTGPLFTPGDRRRCSLVAIAAADLAKGSRTSFIDAAEALRAVIGDRPVTVWNDSPGRRVSEVLDAFTAAATAERGTA